MQIDNKLLLDTSILCVEDDPVSRHFLSRILSLGFPDHRVLVAGDGHAGLELFRKHRSNIVLTDISMPVMDGIMMAREIRRLSPDTFIIALSANCDLHCPPEERIILFDRTLLKPTDRKELIDIINDRITGVGSETIL